MNQDYLMKKGLSKDLNQASHFKCSCHGGITSKSFSEGPKPCCIARNCKGSFSNSTIGFSTNGQPTKLK
jgi:hypothetical protein